MTAAIIEQKELPVGELVQLIEDSKKPIYSWVRLFSDDGLLMPLDTIQTLAELTVLDEYGVDELIAVEIMEDRIVVGW